MMHIARAISSAPVETLSVRRLALLKMIFSAVLIACAFFWYSSTETDSVLAVATSVAVVLLTLLVILKRPSFADATFVFMSLALIYQILIPWIYATGVVAIDKEGSFFVNNWDLLVRGNFCFIIGLAAYALGMWVCPQVRPTRHAARRELLRLSDADNLIFILLLVAFVAWLVMLVRSAGKVEWQILLGQPPWARSREISLTEGGFGYLLELTFGSSIAIVVYALRHPAKSLLSPQMILLYYGAFVLGGFFASRLFLVAGPLSVLMLRRLLFEHEFGYSTAHPAKVAKPKKTGLVRLATASLLVFPLAVLYTDYRVNYQDLGQAHMSRFELSEFNAVNMFDTAITYYMVLAHVPADIDYWNGASMLTPIILHIPHALLPEKYNILYGARRFTSFFYGYDLNESGTVARGPDMMAEAYLNGGVYAVAGLMFCFGLCNEYLSRRVRSAASRNLFTVGYVLYIAYFLPFAWKAGVTGAITYIDVKLLALFIPVFLLSRLKKPSPVAASAVDDTDARHLTRRTGLAIAPRTNI